jgi:hypothetical protein
MARIDWIEQRLQNWARWSLMRGSGVLGYSAVDLSNPTPGIRDPYAQAPIPTNEIEASETDDAVQRLPGELKITVIEAYVGTGGLRQKLARLCCAERTLHDRIDRAHRLLANHFLAQQDKAKAERERVEALQQSVKPGFYGAQ